MKSLLVILAAPSGSGKTTLCGKLLQAFTNLELSISSTTRKPRGQEVHGREYYFLTPEEFQSRIDRNSFAEWAEVHGARYGTEKKNITEAWGRGHHVLLDVDVQGARSFRAAYPGQTISIFVTPPSIEELRRRLQFRGTDSPESIERRLKTAQIEMAAAPEFDFTIVNDQLESAYQKLHSIVKQHIGARF